MELNKDRYDAVRMLEEETVIFAHHAQHAYESLRLVGLNEEFAQQLTIMWLHIAYSE